MDYKVLVGCPVTKIKSYCVDEFIESLKNLTYQNIEFYFCDNSPDRSMQKLFNKHGFECGYISPKFRGNIDAITESANCIREEAIKRNCDYFLSLECDVFPPYNIIEQLLSANKDVIGAMYHINHDENSHLMLQLPMDISNTIMNNLSTSFDIMFVDGNTKRVFACGLGCCLISKRVFGNMPFRYQKNTDAHHDTLFFSDLFYKKIPVYSDTSIICKHLNQKWDAIKRQKDYAK